MATPLKLVPEAVVILRTEVFKVREDWPDVIQAILAGRYTGTVELHCIDGMVKAVHVKAKARNSP